MDSLPPISLSFPCRAYFSIFSFAADTLSMLLLMPCYYAIYATRYYAAAS